MILRLRRYAGRVVIVMIISLITAAITTTYLVYAARTTIHHCISDSSELVKPATTLWYNSPSMAIHKGRLYLSYVFGRTVFGDSEAVRLLPYIGKGIEKVLVSPGSYGVGLSSFDQSGRNISNTKLRAWQTPDDHGGPTLLSLKNGLVAAYSHHSSPLYVRTGGPNWSPEKLIDTARVTYPKLTTNGKRVFLVYARGQTPPMNGRDLVFRSSLDGGRSWSGFTTMVTAKPEQAVYAARAVAISDSVCTAYVIYKPFTRKTGRRNNLRFICANARGALSDRSIYSTSGAANILVYDIAIDQNKRRIAFAVCPKDFDADILWRDCPARIATVKNGSVHFADLGMTTSLLMRGGMSFDQNNPNRVAVVQRDRNVAGIRIYHLEPNPVSKFFMKTADFPANPQFTGWANPSLVWNSIKWQQTGYHHDIRISGRCGPGFSRLQQLK